MATLLLFLQIAPMVAQRLPRPLSPAETLLSFIVLRRQITNALPDLVICGEAASVASREELSRLLVSGGKKHVGSLRIMENCPPLYSDVIRRNDLVTLFVREWPSRTTGRFEATACDGSHCMKSRSEQFESGNLDSIRFTRWVIDD
ncbi:MAG: hypothetical protein SFU84_00175 [Gemmatimonadales bacterium]|nr:hypothetical protein [Gemmatimonadales bacterium]